MPTPSSAALLQFFPCRFVECVATLRDTRVLWEISGHVRDCTTQRGSTLHLSVILLPHNFPCRYVGPELRHPCVLEPQPFALHHRPRLQLLVCG